MLHRLLAPDRAFVRVLSSEAKTCQYVDFLRARYDRAEVWLSAAAREASSTPSLSAKVTADLGSIESDRANCNEAMALLNHSIAASRTAGDVRREAYARSMSGQIHLLRGDLNLAAERLDEAVELSEESRWLAFLPWPQALRGEVELAAGNTSGAIELFKQSFARACWLSDPCWQGASARGLALGAAAVGEIDRSFELLADARSRCNRLAGPYVWLDAYILDAQCTLGREHGHPDAKLWVEALHYVSSRAGMKELVVRSLAHGAAMGREGDAAAALLLGTEIDNPVLRELLAV